MKSNRIIRHFKTINHWRKGLEKAASATRAEEEAGVYFTEEERKQLCEALTFFQKAKAIVASVYAKRIGTAVTGEICGGECKP